MQYLIGGMVVLLVFIIGMLFYLRNLFLNLIDDRESGFDVTSYNKGTSNILKLLQLSLFKLHTEETLLEFENLYEAIFNNMSITFSDEKKLEEWNAKLNEWYKTKEQK